VDEKNYKRFDQKNTVFSRAQWDKTLSVYGKWITTNREDIINSKKPGYSRIEFAMSDAGWMLHDNFHYAFTWTGAKPDQSWKMEKYEPEDWKEFTNQLKKVAKFFGAAKVGVTKVDERWLYSGVDLPKGVDTAIVMLVEMEKDGIATSPSMISSAVTAKAYSKMAFILTCVGEFIRNLGYRAIQCGNDTALSIPLAIDAGLGALGRNGLLVTKEYGPRVRICKIFTDMPLVCDEPDYEFIEFLSNFCSNCLKCAQACEKEAISFEKGTFCKPFSISNNPGVKKFYIDPEKCFEFWVENGNDCDCSNCIAACPFSKIGKKISAEEFWNKIDL